MGLPGQDWEENQGENWDMSLCLNKSDASPHPPSNIQAQFAASVPSVQPDDAKFYRPLPPAWGAAVGWVNPARSHRMLASAEFHSIGPRLGNAPKCMQKLLYQPSSSSANRCDLYFPDRRNLLRGGASLLWAGVVAVHIRGVYKSGYTGVWSGQCMNRVMKVSAG